MAVRNQGSCFLCRGIDLVSMSYLRLNSGSLLRNVGYIIPATVGALLSTVSARFEEVYRPISVNKKYFNRDVVYCRSCSTGHVLPLFSEDSLISYYSEFYWSNRDRVEGNHRPDEDRPNPIQLEWSNSRIAWIEEQDIKYSSVLDFGAGDCAATYALLQNKSADKVYVVDPSARAQELAIKYGATYSARLDDAPQVDLVYSAHSIEHVHDLLATIKKMIFTTCPGGYIFIETPNIGDEAVFSGLVHTPHTFMISSRSVLKIVELMGLKIVSMEVTGPRWRDNFPKIRSEERTDLRVLLQTPTVRAI